MCAIYTIMIRHWLHTFWSLGNMHTFMRSTRILCPVLLLFGAAVLVGGVLWGVFFAPADYRQGHAVRIIYLHVPSALMAINGWLIMVAGSLVWVIRRHWLGALVARAAAPIGLVMALIAVFTGAVWGKPIWGTYWVFEPRLTSFLILCGFYIAYIVLWMRVDALAIAADLTAVLCLVGSLFAVLSRYAVYIWANGLHQGASLSLDKANNIHNGFYIPLVTAIMGMVLLCAGLVILRTRMHIMQHKVKQQRITSSNAPHYAEVGNNA